MEEKRKEAVLSCVEIDRPPLDLRRKIALARSTATLMGKIMLDVKMPISFPMLHSPWIQNFIEVIERYPFEWGDIHVINEHMRGDSYKVGLSDRSYTGRGRWFFEKHYGVKLPLNIHIHHIDGNPLNDALDNLMPLTPLDHMHITLDAQYERGYDRFEVVKVRNQLETYWGVIMAKRDLERLRGE